MIVIVGFLDVRIMLGFFLDVKTILGFLDVKTILGFLDVKVILDSLDVKVILGFLDVKVKEMTTTEYRFPGKENNGKPFSG